MKIIYHHRTQMDDAQGIHIMEIIKAFKELGHDVKLLSLVKRNEQTNEKSSGRHWDLISKIVPNFIYELMEIAYNFFAYFKLATVLHKLNPHFIYERYSMYNFCGVLIAKRKNIPIILEVNAPLFYEQSHYEKLTFKKFAKRIENWICNNATKTIVVTSALRDILIDQGVEKEKLVVMSNGINSREFNNRKKYVDIRSRYGIANDQIVIGIIGWFREWHGLDLLVQTCYENDLFNQSNINLLFVGDGPAVPSCKELVRELKIEDKVNFTGAVTREHIPAYLDAIDIALQPKVTSYASPMKILEYMAMGKAIIAPDQQNIRDILVHNENALLFEPDNKKNLYQQIELLIKNQDLMLKISEGALNTIKRDKLYWSENAKKVINIIQNNN